MGGTPMLLSGFTERLYRVRTEYRRSQPNTPPPRKPGPDESHPSH